MTHDPMALILAAPTALLALYLGWSGFRMTLHAPADADAEATL